MSPVTMSSTMERRSTLYRGHRIVLVRLDDTWHAVVHARSGTVIERDIEGRTWRDAMAQAEWVIERRLAFRPPAPMRRAS